MSERDLLAAEHALGLLEGEELVEARGLVASDPAFARAVAEWEARLAPLLDEVGAVEPPQAVWQRVRAAIAAPPAEGGNVVELRRKLGRWQALAAGASAIAASLAVVVAYNALRPPPAAVEPGSADVMLAALMNQDKTMLLSAAWRPADNSLMIMPETIRPAPGHSHELWIIPADGKPRSLGIVHARTGRMAVDPVMAPHFAGTPTLAVSVEPEGGSPGEAPSGPVIATGQLQKV